jgi:putative transposase
MRLFGNGQDFRDPQGLHARLGRTPQAYVAKKVSRQFVANVMRERGFDPGPWRGEKTWDEFLKMHAATLWQCDFFSHKVLTLRGVREFFLIAFLHVGSRKVFVTKATEHPTAEWVMAQAEAFHQALPANGLPAKLVFHDRDSKFGRAFDDTLRGYGIETRQSPIKAPKCMRLRRALDSVDSDRMPDPFRRARRKASQLLGHLLRELLFAASPPPGARQQAARRR